MGEQFSLADRLAEITELNRVVRPEEAESLMRSTLAELDGVELVANVQSIQDCIGTFLKRRRKILTEEFEKLLSKAHNVEIAELQWSLLNERWNQFRILVCPATAGDENQLRESTNDLSESIAKLNSLDEPRRFSAKVEALESEIQNYISETMVTWFSALVAACEERISQIQDDKLIEANRLINYLAKKLEHAENFIPLCDRRVSVRDKNSDFKYKVSIRLLEAELSDDLAGEPWVFDLIRNLITSSPDVINLYGNSKALILPLLLQENPKHEYPLVRNDLATFIRRIITYCTTKKTPLQFSQEFKDLSAADLYLASKYGGEASLNLDGLTWEYVTVFLRDEKRLRKFMVEGLQPRIAENAFHHLRQVLKIGSEEELRDLNLEAFESGVNYLPREDFATKTTRFDVKSNRYYRASQKRSGLRGFFIGLDRQSGVQVAAFVFYDSSDEHAACEFIGYMEERQAPKNESRTSTFEFSLPKHLHFQIGENSGQAISIKKFLEINTRKVASMNNSSDRQNLSALLWSITKLIEDNVESIEKEYWTNLTNNFFEWRNKRTSACEVYSRLQSEKTKIFSTWNLIRFASIDGKFILIKWIVYVLEEINLHWDKICCPSCGGKDFQLTPHRITSLGTLLGKFKCSCNYEIPKLTLLAHCVQCGHQPLVIGSSKVCGACFGLICGWIEKDKPICGACKCKPSLSLPIPYGQK
jgi:hypothetical protein